METRPYQELWQQVSSSKTDSFCPCSAASASVTHSSATLTFSQRLVVAVFTSCFPGAEQMRPLQSISFKFKPSTKWFEFSFNNCFGRRPWDRRLCGAVSVKSLYSIIKEVRFVSVSRRGAFSVHITLTLFVETGSDVRSTMHSMRAQHQYIKLCLLTKSNATSSQILNFQSTVTAVHLIFVIKCWNEIHLECLNISFRLGNKNNGLCFSLRQVMASLLDGLTLPDSLTLLISHTMMRFPALTWPPQSLRTLFISYDVAQPLWLG